MTWIREYFSSAREQITNTIALTQHDQVLSKDPEEWIDELIENVSLPLIEEIKEPIHEFKTEKQGYRDYGRETVNEVVYSEVDWEVVHHPKLRTTLSLHSSPHDPTLPSIDYRDGHIRFRVRIGNATEIEKPFIQEKARTELVKAIEGHRKEFNARNEQIEKEISHLRNLTADIVKRRIEAIKKKDIALEKLSEKIQIPLRKKNEEIKIISIKPKKDLTKTTVKKKILPTGKPKEYILDRETFLKFLGYIDRYMKDCERTPIPFCKLKEEEIRDLLLPYLNQVFEKGATGETFSKLGKTDIYLVVDKGCILICECKWWRGAKSLNEVIDQVLDRVTWGDDYGVVIIFVKQDMTQVLTKAREIIKSHESNSSRQVSKVADRHFMSKNMRTEDKHKNVEIHYLFYNFVSKLIKP